MHAGAIRKREKDKKIFQDLGLRFPGLSRRRGNPQWTLFGGMLGREKNGEQRQRSLRTPSTAAALSYPEHLIS